LILAVLQGIAAQVAELVDLVATDLGAPLRRLRVDGGLVRSRRLLQAVADLAQLPVDVYPSAHATALGAAAFGRLAITPDLMVDDASLVWEPAATFEPHWSGDRAAGHRARWRAAVTATLGLDAS
jgi:glycerol kinase